MHALRSIPLAMVVSTSLLLLPAADALAGCQVTLKGAYTTSVSGASKVLVYLNGTEPANTIGNKTSQVRIKLGTWNQIKGCTWSTRTYYPGNSFTVACTLDFGCKSDRRYRVYVSAVDNSGVVINDGFDYFPSSDGWTESTTVDFGDLGAILQ
jgi:hypothetical protein